jgi:pimeloyl-ACP methyl ester carboxylesterase
VGRARFAFALAALVAALLAAPAADAGVRWHRCGGIQCGRLVVPLDRSGIDRGTVSLSVQRRKAERAPRRGVTLLLAGGPGQSAILAYGGDLGGGKGAYFERFRPYGDYARLTPRNDVVVFDQRGTGGSDPLRCRDFEAASGLDPGRSAEACATLLGPKRAHYTTSDSVDDIEALRLALGAPKLTLIGVSYGTYVAERYAIRYPQAVDRLVLDSVVDTAGVDPLYRDTFAAVKRVLGQYCRRGCDFTHDPVADLGALVAKLAQGPIGGTVGLPDGRRRRATLTRQGLLYSFGAGDLATPLRADFPAAVVSALRGDPAPLLRAQRRGLSGESARGASEFSGAVYAATACEETPFPYSRAEPLLARAALGLQAAEQAGPAFAPFDAWTAARNDLMRLCRRWPTTLPGPKIEPGPLPDVPTLLLEGAQDTRTPVETALRVLGQLPRGKLVVTQGAGHSVSGNGGCPDRAVARFLAGKPGPARCRGNRRAVLATRMIPASLGAVKPLRGIGGVRGRALSAALLTEEDAALEFAFALTSDPYRIFDPGAVEGAGLRGGRFSLGIDRHGAVLRLRRAELVPGVQVSGVLQQPFSRRQHGRLRIEGPRGASGKLRVRGGGARGRLGGRPVHAPAFTFAERDVIAAGADGTADVREIVRYALKQRASATGRGRRPPAPPGPGDR